MRYGLHHVALFLVVVSGLFLACGSQSARTVFEPPPDASADAGENGIDGGGDGATGFGTAPCDRLDCKVAECGAGPTTTLTGKVYDPAGVNPLYNVQVYVPSLQPGADLPPFRNAMTSGIACETCGSVALNPMTSALTNAKGEFTLENVPVDPHVPVVIQVGKWRRKFDIEVSNACAENSVPDGTLKLPKNGAEGDMPQIAVTTAACDSLECFLRGLGIDDSEFVSGHGGTGHVHTFRGNGGRMGEPAEAFWNDEEQLKKYDLVLLSCECTETLENKGGSAQGARLSMYNYLNAGGRVFATHFQYGWFKYSPAEEFRRIANWGTSGMKESDDYDINVSFPKGATLAQWLVDTGVSSTPGKLFLTAVNDSVTAVNAPATTWISRSNAPKYFTFNTPIGVNENQQCGRAVFTDVHISESSGPRTIQECEATPGVFTGQRKAMEFLFFDLSSCVQNDQRPPTPPK